MTIPPNIKAKIDELKLEERVAGAAATVEKAARTGIGKAGEYVHSHSGQIKSALDSASTKLHDKTGGKYDGAVEKVRGIVDAGVSKIAGQGGAAEAASDAADTAADTVTETATEAKDTAKEAAAEATEAASDASDAASEAASDAADEAADKGDAAKG